MLPHYRYRFTTFARALLANLPDDCLIVMLTARSQHRHRIMGSAMGVTASHYYIRSTVRTSKGTVKRLSLCVMHHYHAVLTQILRRFDDSIHSID